MSEPALPLLLAALHAELGRSLLIVLPEDADARDAADAASWYLGPDTVALLPSRGVSPSSGLEPPPHLVGERARALAVLDAGGLVCASAPALVEGMPPLSARPAPIELRVGDEPGLDGLSRALALAGYERVERVDERGQFAVRGGIVDVFPSTGREPLRVELFGDEIEQVRAFSPFTQRALHPVAETVVYPAAERRRDLAETMLPTHEWEEEDGPGEMRLPDDLVPPVGRAPDLVWQPDDVRRVCEEASLPTPPFEGAAELDPFPRGQAFQFEAQRPAIAARGLAEAENELAGFLRSGNRVVVAFPHKGEALRQKALLRKVDATPLEDGEQLPVEPALRFAVSPARRGFVWRELGLVLLPDTQVFRKKPPRADARLGRALASFADLRVGDYVVHEDHGVGKLLGFETKAVAGVTRDYLFLAFRGDDRLYVPHEQLGKLSKYIGADAKAPALSKLGGKAWQNLKARARESVRELAGELLALYAQRQRAEGVTFDLRNEWLERLETSFPYRETDDQARAIEAVKEDLEAPRPMDRLVCGDVGFGKTEVAVRAAFAVAVNGKQALVLCPTTILAEQHWNTFRDRYRDFPVRVEMVSRFRKPAETKQVLADFAAGKVDVLVGTHRVLSRDVIPRELGLVILDEEQRFGVAQKELLRSLRLEVDVLALSATPIPRTLHMSLSGLRDISIIETPPEGRRPIRTIVDEYDEEAIRVALEREHAREGQSFYLHNRVETIDEVAAKLQQLCPGLRFLVAHGQMSERDLEERMHAFLAGDADVLVSTTIIESGIDIPQANTLIVERADMLGLSQLYQIRGRVGRSDVTAHAHLYYPDAERAHARGACPAVHPRRPYRARRRLPDRDARPRDPRCRRPARGRAVRACRRARLRVVRRDAERGGGRALGPAAARRPARARRRAGGCLHPRLLRRLGGAQDRPAPQARARRGRGRAARAPCGHGGPLWAAAGAGAEPLRDPGGEAEARPGRRRLSRLPRRPCDDRSAHARLPGATCPPRRRRHRRLHERPAGDRVAHRGSQRGARLGRCYSPRPPGRLNRCISRPQRRRIRTEHNADLTLRRLHIST